MEAKDAVMTWDKIVKLTGFVSDIDSHPAKRMRELAKAQAEISFKAGETVGYNAGFIKGREWGKSVGIREVVEWLKTKVHCYYFGPITQPEGPLMDGFEVGNDEWQQILKEWGD